MEALDTPSVQRISLEILSYIDSVCRKNDINYSLFYGTLIGLERHQGFIPWDDDIDIVLPRPSYTKLMALLAEQNDYQLLAPGYTPHYRYTFGKLVDKHSKLTTKQIFSGEDSDMGVFVDIFPLDVIPSDENERQALYEKCRQDRLNMMDTLPGRVYAQSYSRVKSLVKWIIRYPHYRQLLHKGNDTYWYRQYETDATCLSTEKTGVCGNVEWINMDWGVFPSKWFEAGEYEDVMFAGRTFMAIKSRVDFLHLRFGEFMKLPPKEQQRTNHPYTFLKR